MTNSEKVALVVVDMQQGFLDDSWGLTTNHPGCEENVERLLAAWSVRGMPIVVVRHDSIHESSPLYAAGQGNALIPAVAEAQPDLTVTKSVNSAFYGTPDLRAWLEHEGIDEIVVCGIQTNMCVETTARMGGNLGFDVVVPLDATRTFDLTDPDGTVVPAAALMRVTATNLQGGGFARVTTTEGVIAALGDERPQR